MTYVEKLQNWYDTERAAGRILDIKFFPNYIRLPGDGPNGEDRVIKLFEGPDPTIEQMAETAYKLLTGGIPSTEVDVSELDL